MICITDRSSLRKKLGSIIANTPWLVAVVLAVVQGSQITVGRVVMAKGPPVTGIVSGIGTGNCTSRTYPVTFLIFVPGSGIGTSTEVRIGSHS